MTPRWPRRCAPIATFSSTLMRPSRRTCWKVRDRPSRAMRRAPAPATCWPSSVTWRGGRVHAGYLVEHGALACAVGADQRQDLARADLQVHGVVGHQPAELAGHVHRLEHHLPPRRHGVCAAARRQVQLALDLAHRHPARQQGPQAAARSRCSSSTMPKPNTMTSKLPVWPSTLGSKSCSHCLSTVNTPAPTSAPHTWPRRR